MSFVWPKVRIPPAARTIQSAIDLMPRLPALQPIRDAPVDFRLFFGVRF